MLVAVRCAQGSFANRSEQRRITLNFGFFKRSQVLHAKPDYDEARVEALCDLIPLAVAFRQQSRGEAFGEAPFVYKPRQGREVAWEGWGAPATVAALRAPGLGI